MGGVPLSCLQMANRVDRTMVDRGPSFSLLQGINHPWVQLYLGVKALLSESAVAAWVLVSDRIPVIRSGERCPFHLLAIGFSVTGKCQPFSGRIRLAGTMGLGVHRCPSNSDTHVQVPSWNWGPR